MWIKAQGYYNKKARQLKLPGGLLKDIYFLRGFSIAACAAASLAIGTRNGEQLT